MALSKYWKKLEITPIDSIYSHTCTYSVVNVGDMKLYEASILDREEEKDLCTIEDLAPDAQT
jgi:hypothetical protein